MLKTNAVHAPALPGQTDAVLVRRMNLAVRRLHAGLAMKMKACTAAIDAAHCDAPDDEEIKRQLAIVRDGEDEVDGALFTICDAMLQGGSTEELAQELVQRVEASALAPYTLLERTQDQLITKALETSRAKAVRIVKAFSDELAVLGLVRVH